MKEQGYKTHKQFVTGFHFVAFGLLCMIAVLSIYSAVTSAGESDRQNFLIPAILCMVAVYLFITFFYMRIFALKAQDRAIRAEEALRYYIISGDKMPDLTMGQVIALRFASDSEFVELCKKASAEKLLPDEIKRSIRDWKADLYRV